MNPLRSEAVVFVDGAPVPLRLTLSALAEIEALLGAADLPDLAVRLASPSAGQLLGILRACARAAGHGDPEAVGGEVSLPDVLAAVTILFREVLTGEAPGKR